ncbi:MAG: Bacterial pre-peptidase C-terminal domain family, partial [bacterium]
MRSQNLARGLLFCLIATLAPTTAAAQCSLPDLQAWSLQYDAIANPGRDINLAFQVSNLNPGFPPSGTATVRVVASTDRILDDGDLVLETWTLAGSDLTAPHTGTAYLPSNFPAGSYHGLLVVDVFGTIAECDEGNNVASSVNADLVVRAADDHPDIARQTRPVADELSHTATSMQAAIETGGDTDFYRITVSAGAQYTLATELGTLSDTKLSVYDSTGTVLAENDDITTQNRASLVHFTGPASGPVYARVTAYSTTQTGTYRLVLTPPADDHPD